MTRNSIWFFWILATLCTCDSAPPKSGAEGGGRPAEPLYTYRNDHDPDGIGKFYLGREIAHVMGHPGAEWLERPERESEERPDALVQLLAVKPGAVIADVGAGSGYLTRRLARATGAGGRVYAVDVQREMIEVLTRNMRAAQITNVIAVLGTETDPKLPAGAIDLIVLVDVYHEFAYPYEMMEALVRSLKPGGQIAFVEYRAEDPSVPIKPVHKMTEAQVKREARMHPLEWEKTISDLPRQHLVLFRTRKR